MLGELNGEWDKLNVWDELRRIHEESLEKCAEIEKLAQEDLLSVSTERFTACGDFKTKATVLSSRATVIFYQFEQRLYNSNNHAKT